jgi:hypothetical protein
VAALVAVALPLAFVAVTEIVMVFPTSAVTGAYVAAVAEAGLTGAVIGVTMA